MEGRFLMEKAKKVVSPPKLISLVLVVAMVLSLANMFGVTAMAATTTVSTETDLVSALASASSGDTITIGADITLNAVVTIPAGISIDGAGHTITDINSTAFVSPKITVNGGGSSTTVQPIIITQDGVKITDLTVAGPTQRGGHGSSDYGTGIYATGSLTLDNVQILDIVSGVAGNKAQRGQALVAGGSGDVSITNSKIDNFSKDGIDFYSTGLLTLDDVTISVTTPDGDVTDNGLILAAGRALVTNCTFSGITTGNTAYTSCAIAAYKGTLLEVYGTTFSNDYCSVDTVDNFGVGSALAKAILLGNTITNPIGYEYLVQEQTTITSTLNTQADIATDYQYVSHWLKGSTGNSYGYGGFDSTGPTLSDESDYRFTIPSEVTIDQPDTTLAGGDTLDLSHSLSTDGLYTGDNPTYAWKSSDDSVATVDSTGKVTAVGVGKATITLSFTPEWPFAPLGQPPLDFALTDTVDITVLGYNVIYHGNGNTGGSVPATDSAVTSATVSVASPGDLAKKGYTFTGWNTEADGSGTAYAPGDLITMGDVDIDLYAQWTQDSTTPPVNPVLYAVTFDPRGGSAVAPQSVAENGFVTEPPAPTRSGYTFGGWYKDKACTEPWDFKTDTVTADMTLYAKWIPVEPKKPPVEPKKPPVNPKKTPLPLAPLVKTGDATAIPVTGMLALLIGLSAVFMTTRRRREEL